MRSTVACIYELSYESWLTSSRLLAVAGRDDSDEAGLLVGRVSTRRRCRVHQVEEAAVARTNEHKEMCEEM